MTHVPERSDTHKWPQGSKNNDMVDSCLYQKIFSFIVEVMSETIKDRDPSPMAKTKENHRRKPYRQEHQSERKTKLNTTIGLTSTR